MRKTVSGASLFLVLAGIMFASAFQVQPVKAITTIYIRSDGSVEGTSLIQTSDNVTYVFTGNINGSIIVQRNNITLDGKGYTLQSPGNGTGFSLSGVSNVTIKNVSITNSGCGIYLNSSSRSILSGNNLTNNWEGIYLYSSTNNTVSGNDANRNKGDGILLDDSSNNTVSDNNVTANKIKGIYLLNSSSNTLSDNDVITNIEYDIYLNSSSDNNVLSGNKAVDSGYGISLSYSSDNNTLSNNNVAENEHGIHLIYSCNNTLFGNNLTYNGVDIFLYSSFGNRVFHNNFLTRMLFHVSVLKSTNTWDDGYPSGGNYWIDYSGVDVMSGPFQNETGSDGIGDTPYVIDVNNTDHYPLMKPWVPKGPTIWIRPDGSVKGTTEIKTIDNVTYSLIGNIFNSFILIQRNNIVVDGKGHMLQGEGSGTGIDLTDRTNVTVENLQIKAFSYGIFLNSSSNDRITRNKITNNDEGIGFNSSSNNTVSRNDITSNHYIGVRISSSSNDSVLENNVTNNYIGVFLLTSSNNAVSANNLTDNLQGIFIYHSSNNTVSANRLTTDQSGIILSSSSKNTVLRNKVTNNYNGILCSYSSNYNTVSGNNLTDNHNGILLDCSSNNTFSGNSVANNTDGILFSYSSKNTIYHNDFTGNTQQAYSFTSTNVWDNGYPSGGNYWSDYKGTDLKCGPNQDKPGSDGIGDTPYTIDANNTDHYPLMKPYHVIPEFPSFLVLPSFMIATLLAVIAAKRKKGKLQKMSLFRKGSSMPSITQFQPTRTLLSMELANHVWIL
jgi:parallel beta-helix repeat protein